MFNPIESFLSANQAKQNPVGFGISEVYKSDVVRSSTPTPTGNTNLANAVKGSLMTGDIIGALIGLGSNALSITGNKTDSKGNVIGKTTYATPFSVMGAIANPTGFGVNTLYGAEMSRSTNKTATGHTNIANSVLGGLAFGPVGAIVGGLANWIGGLFGGGKSSKGKQSQQTTMQSKSSDLNFSPQTSVFGAKGYSGFGSKSYGLTHGLVSSDRFGSIGYTGFGSAGYDIGLSGQTNGYGETGYSGYSDSSGGISSGYDGGSFSSEGYGGFGSDSYAGSSGYDGGSFGADTSGGYGSDSSDSGSSDSGSSDSGSSGSDDGGNSNSGSSDSGGSDDGGNY